MEFALTGTIIEWRGPAPFYFVPIPAKRSAEIKQVARQYTYGWGVLYVTLTCGELTWTTAVIPKDGEYMIPMRLEIRKKLKVDEGDKVKLQVKLGK